MTKYFQDQKVVVGILQSKGSSETPDTTAVTVISKDESGYITKAKGTTVPTNTESGYAKGCLFIDTNVAAGSHNVYENIGTNASCEFDLLGEVDSDDIDASVIKVKEVEISAAEIVQLNSSPKELVAAPGAGKVLEFISAAIFYNNDTADYTTNGNMTVQTGTTGTAQSDTVAGSDCLLASADVYRSVQALSADHQLDANESLVLAVGTGDPVNPGTAAGTLKVRVVYREHDFS